MTGGMFVLYRRRSPGANPGRRAVDRRRRLGELRCTSCAGWLTRCHRVSGCSRSAGISPMTSRLSGRCTTLPSTRWGRTGGTAPGTRTFAGSRPPTWPTAGSSWSESCRGAWSPWARCGAARRWPGSRRCCSPSGSIRCDRSGYSPAAFLRREEAAFLRLAGRAPSASLPAKAGKDAGSQGLHQVDHLRGLRLLAVGDLLALDLLGDQLLEGGAVLVAELLGLEVGREALDQAAGHPHLLRPDLHLLVEHLEARRTDLVGPEHRLQHEDVVAQAQGGQVLLVAEGNLGEGDLAVVHHGLAQQLVGLEAGRLGHQVIGLLEENRVDLVGVDEALDLDRLGAGHRQGVELLLGQGHVVVLLVLVALDDLGILDLFAVDRADALVADAAAVGLVELVEAEALLLGGAVHAHRDRHQPERDRALPDGLHAVLLGKAAALPACPQLYAGDLSTLNRFAAAWASILAGRGARAAASTGVTVRHGHGQGEPDPVPGGAASQPGR